MRLHLFLAALVALVVITECTHTFLGTNVLRKQMIHRNVKYSSYIFQKRVEDVKFTIPSKYYGWTIEGILAYDNTESSASANVTEGGLDFNHVTLRMKSERGSDIDYDVYIYTRLD